MKSYKKLPNRSKNKTVFIYSSAIVLLVLIGAFGYSRTQQDNRETLNEASSPQSVDTIEQVDLSPPSDEIIKDTKNHKDNLSNPQSPTNNPDTTKKSVTPIIVSAGVYEGTFEVSSYVEGVAENGGTCNITLSKGSTSKDITVTAEKDVSKTLCPTATVPSNELEAGSWNVIVNYSSSTSMGSSSEKTVEVK